MSKKEEETKDGKKACARLQVWLKKPGNTQTKAAYLLKYKTSDTIKMWLFRGCVPVREIENVNKLVNGELE